MTLVNDQQIDCGRCLISVLQPVVYFAFLREYPTLLHIRIAHDPAGIECLEEVITQESGLTIIQGESEDDRNFLFTNPLLNWQGVRLVRPWPTGTGVLQLLPEPI